MQAEAFYCFRELQLRVSRDLEDSRLNIRLAQVQLPLKNTKINKKKYIKELVFVVLRRCVLGYAALSGYWRELSSRSVGELAVREAALSGYWRELSSCSESRRPVRELAVRDALSGCCVTQTLVA